MRQVLRYLLLTAFAISYSYGNKPALDLRIVNGSTASDYQFPHQASLRYDGSHFCGGSVVAPRWVLTAAHCVEGIILTRFRIVVGTNYYISFLPFGTSYTAIDSFIHPNYNTTTAIYDVGLYKTKTPITFNIRVQPIPLANSPPSDGSTATVSGWGLTRPEGTSLPYQLQFAITYILNFDVCYERVLNDSYFVHASQICTYTNYNGVCYGDSGGALLANGQQVGIVSLTSGCSRQFPDIYASVPYTLNWIKTITGIP